MLLRRVADIAGRIAAGPIFFMQETNLRSEVMSEPGEKRKMKMVAHVNGWSAIERQLRLQAKKQGELARVLEISQAAVSLMKKGSFLLNPGQLEKIAQFLRFDEETRCEFYTELFNARLISRTASAEPAGEEERGTYRVSRSPVPERKRMCEVPLAELGLLSGYEPLLEPLVDYLLRSSSERRTEALSGTGLCALRVGAEQEKIGLTAGSIILLESGRYPEPDSLNLIALRDGSFLLREYRPEGELVRFRPLWKNSEPDIVWKRQEIPVRISWLHPVLELTLRPLHFPRSS